MQEGCGAFEEHLYCCAKQRHLVEIQPEAAADEAEAVMQKKDQAANSGVEHQGEQSVIDEVAIHDAAPEEVAVCRGGAGEQTVRGLAGVRLHTPPDNKASNKTGVQHGQVKATFVSKAQAGVY